jgi:predicted ATPase
MLSRLSVQNFRLLRDVTIDVEPGKPIVLIGPNGAGKSSVLQVLDLLGRAARDGLKSALHAFGGATALISASAPSAASYEASIDVVMDVNTQYGFYSEEDGAGAFEYSLRLDAYSVAGEVLRARLRDGSDMDVMSRSRNDFSIYKTSDQPLEQQLLRQVSDKLAMEFVKHRGLYDTEDLRYTLSTIGTYDGFLTTPLWARDVREGQLSPFDGAVIEPCTRIDRRGLALVNALYYLQSSHPDEWEELERSFKAEFPFVQRLEFPADPAGGRIGLAFRDRRYPGVRMYGHQMSEGMATYLCLLAAILSPDPATAIAFDEPDRHLHPSALRRVVYLLEKLSERTAVFVATHSDRVLDYLSDPAGSIRVCEPSAEGVSIHKLDREVLEAWRAKFTLSELRRRGQIDPENASDVEP